MNARAVFTIFVKELIETLRDRRALFAAVVLPILLHPLIFLFMGNVLASHEAARKSLKPDLAIWGPVPARVVSALEHDLGARVVERRRVRPADTEDEARRAIETGGVHLVLAADAGADARFAGDESAALDLYYDELKSSSDAAEDRVTTALKTLRASELDARLRRHALPAAFDKPIDPIPHNLTDKRRRAGDLGGGILAFVLLFVIIVSGMLPAIDLTAGEKERGTLQTLLCAPVRPLEIVAGKYLTVVTFSIAGASANLAAMSFALGRRLDATREVLEFSLSAGTYLKIFGAMVPMALTVSALLLALSVFARSYREAQSYLTPIFLMMLLPTAVAILPGLSLDHATAFVPIVNLALLVRALLNGHATAELYALVLIANLVYATLAILLAARIFETEQVLLGGERPWRDVFGRSGHARVTPSPRSVLAFCALLFVVTYYGMLWVAPHARGVVALLCLIEIGFMLAPAAAWVALTRASWRATFSLRLPTARGALGGLLVAAGAWAVGSAIALAEVRLFPGAQQYSRELEGLFGGGGWSLLVAGALLPAIAEEACFRGVILSGLANTGSRVIAVGGSALAFGLFHFNPYHIAVAGTLGLILGFATLESGSIFVGMLAHFVNNGLQLLQPMFPSLARLESRWPLLIGCASTLIGLWLIRGSRAKESVP
jgi:sodium transport system permease protein